VFKENYRAYGRRKMKATPWRESGINLDLGRIERLMRELRIRVEDDGDNAQGTRSREQTLPHRTLHAGSQ
jgi:hypothetical protein